MYCILIAGMPATGKSRFAEWLSCQRHIPYLSKDAVKELLFHELGFRSRAEKVALGNAAMNIIYGFAGQQMQAGQPFIMENNFEDCSREGLIKLLEQYEYEPVTILFDGDPHVIYDRFLLRDQSPERHRGHVVNTSYPETGERPPYVPIGYEAFQAGMEQRGFRRFSVGRFQLTVDCTDFGQVNYDEINGWISRVISGLCEPV